MFILYAQGSSPYRSNPYQSNLLILFAQIDGSGGMFDFTPRRRPAEPAPVMQAPPHPQPELREYQYPRQSYLRYKVNPASGRLGHFVDIFARCLP